MTAAIYARKSTEQNRLRTIMSVSLGTLLVLGVACSEAPTPQPQPVTIAPPPPPPPLPPPPLKVPGSAFVDGRDEDAQPPLTVMQVNVWDAVPRQRRVCQVAHAAAVKLLEAEYVPAEERHYFLIETDGCKGWLPETFLSATRNRATGDKQ